MRLAVVGSINTDMTVTAERIPLKGETLMGSSFLYSRRKRGESGSSNGKAWCSGGDVWMCRRRQQWRKMLENLKAVGVGTEHIPILKGVPTGIAMITVGDNDNTIIVVPGSKMAR